MSDFFLRIKTKDKNPSEFGEYPTDKGNLWYFHDKGEWSCRDDRISDEYPEYWYDKVVTSFEQEAPRENYANVEDMVEKQGIEGGYFKITCFEDWWHAFGSGIIPSDNHDYEEHSMAVAEEAWNAAIDSAFKSARAKIEKAKDDSGEWYTRSVIIESSILKLKK